MTEFECINAFYNIIYGSEGGYRRSFMDTYEHFCTLREWLFHHDIIIPFMNLIDETMFNLAKQCKNLEDLDHLLHMNVSEQIKTIRKQYQDRIHVLFFPGVNQDPWPIFQLKDQNVMLTQIYYKITESYLTVSDPFPGLLEAIVNIDKWPGALVFTKGKHVFYPMRVEADIHKLEDFIHSDYLWDVNRTHASYYLHLSDLHLGPERKEKHLMTLYDSLNTLMDYLHSDHKLKTVVTGDLMNSPSKKNMYVANDFMTGMKKRYHTDLTFVLGNHDMIVNGLNLAGGQKSKVIAYLLGEKLKILEDDHVILIKIDSNSEGSLARGKVGRRQLYEIDEELSTVDHLEDYTLVALLHHHVCKCEKSEFLKITFKEKYVLGKLLDTSKALVDSASFYAWLKRRHIKYVLHGHKHVPFFIKRDDTYIISAGSATGGGLSEDKSKYLSYNLLKYDYLNGRMTVCFTFYIDRIKTDRTRLEVYLMEGDYALE